MSTIDFAGVYDRYAPDVLHFALYLTGDRREADGYHLHAVAAAVHRQCCMRGDRVDHLCGLAEPRAEARARRSFISAPVSR